VTDDSQLRERARYRHWVEERLRFADLDRLGHVNNVAYAVFCENARVVMMRELGYRPGEGEAEWVLARITIDFLAPVFYPGTVLVGTRPMRIGRSSATFGQGLFAGDACVATALSVAVLVDGATGRSRPIPDEARRVLESLAAP
jgi:acyl-CoA thioester hydrolase